MPVHWGLAFTSPSASAFSAGPLPFHWSAPFAGSSAVRRSSTPKGCQPDKPEWGYRLVIADTCGMQGDMRYPDGGGWTQYWLGRLDGFHASTRLDLTPFCNPSDERPLVNRV